jgi:hypothetical protein
MPTQILSSNIIKIISTFWSSALRLMPPQFNERVVKRTHEPRSNLNHKKHLSNTFICTFIFSTKLFRKYKNIFTSLHTQLKPKNIITASYLLYCIFLLYRIAYNIYFYLHPHLVLDNHSVELGTQEWEIILQVAGRRMTRAFSTVPREFDINLKLPSWGKFTLATILCTWSPNLAHLLSVIRNQSKEEKAHGKKVRVLV